MKTHYAEENADVISSNDTADEHCWREHRIGKPQLICDIVITLVLLICLTLSGLIWELPPAPHQDSVATARLPLPSFVQHGSLSHSRADAGDDR